MELIKKIFIFLSVVAILSSCVTSKETNLLQDIPKDYPIVPPSQYKVIPGDLLHISVYAMDENIEELFRAYSGSFSSEYYGRSGTHYDLNTLQRLEGTWKNKPFTVYADGTINFPYLGSIYVGGFTILEIRQVLTDKLEEFATGTSAEVGLQNTFFSVLGEAGARRVDMPNTQITIFQALAISDAIAPGGDRSKVSILRQTKDGSIIKTFDLRTKDIIDSDFYYIQANDVIYVPQSARKFLGAPSSFVSLFSLLSSIAALIVFLFRVV